MVGILSPGAQWPCVCCARVEGEGKDEVGGDGAGRTLGMALLSHCSRNILGGDSDVDWGARG